MRAAIGRVLAVVRTEALTQRREPLTALYMLVFFLLAAAFAAAGPVELVRDRGRVPRDAAWSMMLASTALTAFGQVITTMVAATVVLRDRVDRVDDLLRATPLRSREYLTGKLLAALGLLCAIYAAIPVGLVCGAVIGGGTVLQAARGVIPPFLLVVLPTMLAVGAIQFGLGALSGRLWVIVGQGLLLIWLWNSAVDAAPRPDGALLTLLDPFGSAPLLRGTAAWTDVQRATLAMPVTASLLYNRVLWLLVGTGVAGMAIVRAPLAGTRPAASEIRQSGERSPIAAAVSPVALAPPDRDGARLSHAQAVVATARYVVRWMLRDTGWRVLALLGTLNVAIHVALDASRGMPREALSGLILAAFQLHGQLFLILLATIYAGELVWREREDRSAGIIDALPVSDGDVVVGRIVGGVGAQCALLLMMGVCVAETGVLRSGSMVAPGRLIVGLLVTVLWPFIMWQLLSLAVHAVVQQKVAAHLVCIVGWVVVVRVSGGVTPSGASGIAPSRAVMLAFGALIVTWLGWMRGVHPHRWLTVRRRARSAFVRQR